MSIMDYFNIDKKMICRNCEHYIRYYMRLNHTFFSTPDGRCGLSPFELRHFRSRGCLYFSRPRNPPD